MLSNGYAYDCPAAAIAAAGLQVRKSNIDMRKKCEKNRNLKALKNKLFAAFGFVCVFVLCVSNARLQFAGVLRASEGCS